MRDVSCTKKCDSSVKSDNITNSTSKDIFDDQVTCYDYCYKYLAASKLQITLLMIILAAISIFVIWWDYNFIALNYQLLKYLHSYF